MPITDGGRAQGRASPGGAGYHRPAESDFLGLGFKLAEIRVST